MPSPTDTEVPADDTPSTEDSSLRDSLSQAYDAAQAPPAQEEAAPVKPTAEEPAATAAPEKAEESAPQPMQEEEVPSYDRPIPERLKGRLGEKWATLPPEIRNEFHAYETHIGQMANKYGKNSKSWEETQAAFAPYAEMVKAEGGNFHGAMVNLFETARILRQGSPEQKMALMQEIQRTFNIPTVEPTQAPSPQDGGLSHRGAPAISTELMSRINRLEQGLLTRDAAEVHNARTKVETDLQTFLADPAHVYVQEPGYLDTMAALINAGKATGLDDAYTQAAWLHEGPRAREIARLNAARTASQIEQAARAKAAAVSVNGNAPGPVKLDPASLSLRDTLAAAYDGELN